MLTLQSIARAVGGEINGRQVLAPGPGHSPKDRSLSIMLSSAAPDGFVLHSHAGNDWRECREHVALKLGLPGFKPSRNSEPRPKPRPPESNEDHGRVEYARGIWRESRPISGTVAERYLACRGIDTSGENLEHVLRFHASCAFGQERYPALVALIRNVETDKPQGIQRTALGPDGWQIKRNGKTMRMTLGPMGGGAIKIDDDADVTQGLCIGEGLESTLSGRAYGYRPAWAVLSDSGIKDFPVLSGIEALTIFFENDDNGANARAAKQCIARWQTAGREVFRLRPGIGNDLNDELCAEARYANV